MKKGLLGSTALIGATVLMAGAAGAAEAPEWKLSGNVNFQGVFADQDAATVTTGTIFTAGGGTTTGTFTINLQDGGIYFGVDEAELQLNVSGSTDNGLDYGFKIELNALTTDASAADEARLSLGGAWGTLHLGDEDGAEDTMNYGGENLMGATGGFDGDQDDWYVNISSATSFPTIAGDTSDHTKITYYSPRVSGLQVGGSWTPSGDQDGDEFRIDGVIENHIGLGANYDGEFSGLRVRASAVYSLGSQSDAADKLLGPVEDIGAFSVGGIVNFGQIAVGANYTDNGESGSALGSGDESSYFNVGASFSQGPIGVAVGYLVSTVEFGAAATPDDEYTHLALTADYSLAPGLSAYAEFASITSETGTVSNDGTGIVVGANVSF